VSLPIQVRSDNGAGVALAGAADASMLDPLRDPLRAALADTRALLVDLDEVTALGAARSRDVLVVLETARSGQLCVAAGHDATITRLAEARILVVAVHRRVADAGRSRRGRLVTGAATSVPDESHAAFAVAATAIPLGVRCCRSCGRLHLPARLSPLAIRPLAAGGAVGELRCVRCNAAGSLLLDPESTEHRGLLTLCSTRRARCLASTTGRHRRDRSPA
jgi:hypothetical protein